MRLFYIAFAQSAHTLKWINYFRDNNHDIMLVSFYPAEPIEGVDLRYVRCRNKNAAVFKAGQVKKLIKEFRPDLIHAHYASSCGLVAALTRFHPYVLSVWGDDILEFPNRSPIHRWAVKKAIMAADYVTATSKMLSEATKLLISAKKEIQVIPFGVDLDHYSFKTRSDREIVHIGTVRNLTPKYGLEYLIRAVAELQDLVSQIKLTIVGDGIIRNELESLAVQLGIKEHVNFTGAVPNEKVVGYLHDFDIFVMPSVGEGETFGVAAVEAMATGLPVVASRIGGLPEVVEDGQTGILVAPGDVEQLKQALKSYILSAEKRQAHGKNGRGKVEAYYDWRENGAMMNKLYKNILELNIGN